MIPSEVSGFIEDNRRFLLSTHLNPDGDGLGSAMAMKWTLVKLGKRADIVLESDPPDMFSFFKNYHWITKYSGGMADGEKYDIAVVIDSPNIERLGKVPALFADNARVLNVDHHISNEKFGDVNYIDYSAASSAEMVYAIIKSFGLEIDEECAEYIYTGVIVDTGGFRFSNTTPQTLITASELVAAGAKPARINEMIHFQNTEETTKALGKFLCSIQLSLDGRVATAQFDCDYVNSPQWEKVDTQDFVNHALAIKGVEVAIFLREVKRGITRASLRAKNDFDVNRLANIFGGGGHAKAAGCTIEEPLEKAKASLLNEAAKMMD